MTKVDHMRYLKVGDIIISSSDIMFKVTGLDSSRVFASMLNYGVDRIWERDCALIECNLLTEEEFLQRMLER